MQMIMEEKTRNCVWCDEEFYLVPNGRKQYCSDECYKQRALANNKNPVGYMSGTVGVHESGCCYDEQKLSPSVQWVLDNDKGDIPRITEDTYYILSCLEELPVAKYSDGRPLTSTRAYRHRIAERINVGYKHFKPKELNYKRVNPNPTGTEHKQYATIEDKMAKLEREQQNYTVWEEDDG